MTNIKKLRGLCGLTQKQLAEKTGLTRATIINAEKQETKCLSKNLVDKICKALNCSPIVLYGANNFIYPPQNIDEIEYMESILKKMKEKGVQ